MANLQHLHLPKKQDWMTLEESADNKMDSLLASLINALDEHVLEKEFFTSIDYFYQESKRLTLRNRRTEFDKIVLSVVEALIREKFKTEAYFKYHSWLFDLVHKQPLPLEVDQLPHELVTFLTNKRNLRVEGVLDLFMKRQNPQWFNPYLNYIGLRPEEYFECKILFKNIAQDMLIKSSLSLKNEKWNFLLGKLCLIHKSYIVFHFQDKKFILAARKQSVLAGETVELLLLGNH